MGRKTYEFGYDFARQAGDNPYLHAEGYVISNELVLPRSAVSVHPRSAARALIERLKQNAQGPIYLCGGGGFAGWNLKAGHVDRSLFRDGLMNRRRVLGIRFERSNVDYQGARRHVTV